MPIWLPLLVIGVIGSLTYAWRWWLWLRFCRQIADQHGVDGLKLGRPYQRQLVPIAC